jgi:hypothetical protein
VQVLDASQQARAARNGNRQLIMTHHASLCAVVKNLPGDYTPYGSVVRWADSTHPYPDCSHGCKFFYKLASRNRQPIGMDWGVCGNPESHRAGLLTFEHQGCEKASVSR